MTKSVRTELKSTGYEIFIGVLSILSILNLVLMYALVDDPALNTVLRVMNILFSAIFLADFAYRLTTAPKRGAYFFRHYGWADLLASLPFAELKVLRLFRVVRVVRLMREVGPRTIWRTLVKDRAGSALYALLLMGVLVLQFGSLTMLYLEEDAPGANITTASDALWYTIVTISTVGYGDYYPVTNPGRFAGVVIIVVGVGIFGTFTGYLANLFLGPRKDDGGEAAAPGESAAAASTEPAPTADAGVHPSRPEGRPVDTEATLDEIRSLLTRSEADLDSIRLLLGGPERPTP
ncbi:voltage-gated potassium channel [Agromyces ramosus]|uniref:Voltage-gated potassium channel n=1 Tax=Agromyces ramosus TaxID=33879 RepID=A0A4Q7M9N3_9MICO|nr:ion transporter [Agromyces ramosus]RZS64584.1 voltage-gated potassium channel [Agromyces ramosus]